MQMKILVLGGSGFIGNHLIQKLIIDRNEVVVFDVKRPKQNVEFKRINILDRSLEKNIIENKFDRIVNLAAIKGNSDKSYSEMLKVNSMGAGKIFQLAKDLQIPLVHISSTAVYGEFVKIPADENHPLNPISTYGSSKLLGEDIGKKMMKGSKLSFVIFRPTIIYGPEGDDVITSFIKKGLNKEPITLVDGGKYKRDFLYVKDLVDAINSSINKKISGIFNIGSGKETTILKITKIIQKFIPSLKTIDIKSNKKEVNQGALDISKIKKELNFKPKYSLDMGIQETIQYYISNN